MEADFGLGKVTSNWACADAKAAFEAGQVSVSPTKLQQGADKPSCLICFKFTQPVRMTQLRTRSNAKFFELSIQLEKDGEFKYLGTHRGVKEADYFVSTFTTPAAQRRGLLHGLCGL